MPFLVPDKIREPLYAIVPVQNPWRWKSRWKLAMRALKHFHDSGVVIVLVEVAFNRREFAFADCGLNGTLAECAVLGNEHGLRHRYIPLRSKEELWLKEPAINYGVSQLPYNWQQVCWLDADVQFVRTNWVGETIHKLQHYKFLQMFTQAHDLAPNSELLPENYPHASGLGFAHAFQNGLLKQGPNPRLKFGDDGYYAGRVWPGLAWACTRQAWDEVGGLQDHHIWGGADWVMAHALMEKPDSMMRKDLHPNYKLLCNMWLEKCRLHIRRNVGAMSGVVLHGWHGRKEQRGYNEKHALLARIRFDPLRHLKYDYQGLPQLQDTGEEAFIQLRDTMRLIAQARDEDSTETGQ